MKVKTIVIVGALGAGAYWWYRRKKKPAQTTNIPTQAPGQVTAQPTTGGARG
jgi:uncharacterized membrane protein YebE (DUF533 family)